MYIPVEHMFTWDDINIGDFKVDQYILMHTVVYRTQLLKDCGLEYFLQLIFLGFSEINESIILLLTESCWSILEIITLLCILLYIEHSF